jgi:hypothetical protein
MGILKALVLDGQMARQLNVGDILAGGETIPATVVTTAITVTGAQLAQGNILRNPAAGATDTLDSAANIIAALTNGIGNVGIPPGTTFRVRWICTTAFAITVQATANTGVTVNRGSIAASSAKEFLCTIVNGTPAQTFAGLTTNASAVVTGFTQAQLSLLSVGMIVTNAVAGLQGTTIIAINQAAGSITFSGNANATNTTPVSISFSPVVQLDGLQQGGI